MSTTNATTKNKLEAFRARKDEFFKTGADSPLTPEQRERFAALAYFPENPALSLDLPLDGSGEDCGEILTIGTTDGQAKQFERAGRITFEARGELVTLTVFKEHGRGRYYLPFRDATAGAETYAVGRYLDIRTRPNGDLLVDFNYAYNPYCAYGDGWSCPIPPRENVIKARIEAGEKAFTDRAEYVLE